MEFFKSAIDVLQTLVTKKHIERKPPSRVVCLWRPRRDSNARPFA